MLSEDGVKRTNLRTPKAAAIAGIVFSIALFLAFGLLRVSVPTKSLMSDTWLGDHAKAITVALSLLPFAGIAFLWFIGVLRDRLGQREDRLFATVFLGSGLLFLAMLFSAAAVASAAVVVFSATPDQPIDLRMLAFARALVSDLMNVYAIKMAGVFMFRPQRLSSTPGSRRAISDSSVTGWRCFFCSGATISSLAFSSFRLGSFYLALIFSLTIFVGNLMSTTQTHRCVVHKGISENKVRITTTKWTADVFNPSWPVEIARWHFRMSLFWVLPVQRLNAWLNALVSR